MAEARNIKEHMEVFASDGERVGLVDGMEGSSSIKLTKTDPGAGGQHHFIPMDWVARVDSHVHLSKSAKDVRSQWTTAA